MKFTVKVLLHSRKINYGLKQSTQNARKEFRTEQILYCLVWVQVFATLDRVCGYNWVVVLVFSYKQLKIFSYHRFCHQESKCFLKLCTNHLIKVCPTKTAFAWLIPSQKIKRLFLLIKKIKLIIKNISCSYIAHASRKKYKPKVT